MKTKLSLILMVLTITTSAQTIVKNVPIIAPNNDPYTIEAFTYNEATNSYKWMDVKHTNLEYMEGWNALGEVNRYCPQDRVEYYRFKVGSEKLNCYQYTYLEIHGGISKEKIKDKPDLRVKLNLDGGTHIFGTPIEKPKNQ